MHPFEYLRPASVAEAIAAFRAAEDGKFLAGGMTLIPALKQRLASPTHLIDLSGIPGLATIRLDGGELVIGAMTPHGAVAASPEVKSAIPALADLASSIGDPQVRNRGNSRRLHRQQRPGGGLPGGCIGARCHDYHRPPRDPGR